MNGKNTGPVRKPICPWLVGRLLVHLVVFGIVVPLLIVTSVGTCGLPESIGGVPAGAALLAYLYGSYRWFKWRAERLETPSARAWYRRKVTRRS